MEKKKCRGCNSDIPMILLHNVPHGGRFAPLCTSCVLASNRDLFCPICFQQIRDGEQEQVEIYHKPSSNVFNQDNNDSRLSMCTRCPSLAHVTCLPQASSSSSSSSSYLCPNCSSNSPSYFDLRFDSSGNNVVFTRDLSVRYLCAAKIASVTMHEAAVRARVKAEQKAREALLARYRAKEAIHRVAYLVAAKSESEVDD